MTPLTSASPLRSATTFAACALAFLALAAVSLASMAGAQAPSPFAGTWKLNPAQSKLQTISPPGSAVASITFDGTHWHYQRKHEYAARKPEIFSFDLQLNAPQPSVEKDGPFTFASRLTREGEALVLHQDITAANGEKASSVIRYTLANHAQTLIETERKLTPSHEETNRWVFDRVLSRGNTRP